MSSLLRLIYVSRATGPVDTEFMDGLLAQARARNESLGLTGILCSGRGYFIQALEGPETPVMSLYGRILRDSRHKECSLLSIGMVSSRAFPQWSITLVEGEPLGPDLRIRLVNKVLLDRDPSEPVKLLQEALKSLRKAS